MKIIKDEKLTENQKVLMDYAKKEGKRIGDNLTESVAEFFKDCPFSDEINESDAISFVAAMNNQVIASALTAMVKITSCFSDSGNTVHTMFDEMVTGVRFMLNLPETKHQISELKSITYQDKLASQLEESFKAIKK